MARIVSLTIATAVVVVAVAGAAEAMDWDDLWSWFCFLKASGFWH